MEACAPGLVFFQSWMADEYCGEKEQKFYKTGRKYTLLVKERRGKTFRWERALEGTMPLRDI